MMALSVQEAELPTVAQWKSTPSATFTSRALRASSLTPYALNTSILPGSQQYHCAGNSMPRAFDQDSPQFVDDGTGQTSEIACYADISIDPAPSYQKFFDEP